MAILVKPAAKSAHWYTSSGEPAHRQATARGGERATTIADAKRLHLLPSVTSVLGILAKPGLDTWKQKQAALAARANPPTDGESDDYWLKRVIDAAFAQVEEAADLGSAIHKALEQAMAGEDYDQTYACYVAPAVAWRESVAIRLVEREVVVVNVAEGFAGTMDVAFRYGKEGVGVLDYKTRKTEVGKAVTPYDGQGMQLAAYAATYWGEDRIADAIIANVYISTTEPGRLEVCKHENGPELWDAFKHTAAIWRHLKGYDPRQPA